MPSRTAFRDIVGGLVRPAHGDVAAVQRYRALLAGEDGRHMLIGGDGLLGEIGRSFVGLAALTECQESAG